MLFWLVAVATLATSSTFALVSPAKSITGNQAMAPSRCWNSPLRAKPIEARGDGDGDENHHHCASPHSTTGGVGVRSRQGSKPPRSGTPASETMAARLWAAGLVETVPWHAGSKRYLDAIQTRRS